MKEDNNPFQPTLSKPVDDSVLATDPNADNFLAGDDHLAKQANTNTQGTNIDGIKPSTSNSPVAIPHLDQMTNDDTTSTPPIKSEPTIADLAAAAHARGGDITGLTGDTSTVSANVFEAVSADVNEAPKDGKKAKKHHLLGRKKKDDKKADSSNDDAEADSMKSFFANTNNTDKETMTTTTDNSDNTLNQTSDKDSLMGNTNPLLAALDDKNNDNTTTTSSISDSLSAAAETADNKPLTANGKASKGKNGQNKQVTISVLTIVFFVLFVAAGALAGYFYYDNNKNKDSLADAQAELQQLKDETNASSDSSNKASTQFDALQDKIAELTTQNEDKQKTLDENKKTIDDLNAKNADLQKQVTDAQNKLTSDTQLSEKVQSMLTTMCTNPEFATSSVCIDANGGNAAGGAAQANQQN